MFVNGNGFSEEWREGFAVTILNKDQSKYPGFSFTFTTMEEAEAVKIVIDKMVAAQAISNIESVYVSEVLY